MQPGETLPVLHILKEKFGDLIMPNILKFDLCLSKGREIFAQISQADSDSGSYSFIMRTECFFKGTKEELLDWFINLSSGDMYFFFDRVFVDAPIEEGEIVYEEF